MFLSFGPPDDLSSMPMNATEERKTLFNSCVPRGGERLCVHFSLSNSIILIIPWHSSGNHAEEGVMPSARFFFLFLSLSLSSGPAFCIIFLASSFIFQWTHICRWTDMCSVILFDRRPLSNDWRFETNLMKVLPVFG